MSKMKLSSSSMFSYFISFSSDHINIFSLDYILITSSKPVQDETVILFYATKFLPKLNLNKTNAHLCQHHQSIKLTTYQVKFLNKNCTIAFPRAEKSYIYYLSKKIHMRKARPNLCCWSSLFLAHHSKLSFLLPKVPENFSSHNLLHFRW